VLYAREQKYSIGGMVRQYSYVAKTLCILHGTLTTKEVEFSGNSSASSLTTLNKGSHLSQLHSEDEDEVSVFSKYA
jgi:hypothetical protein